MNVFLKRRCRPLSMFCVKAHPANSRLISTTADLSGSRRNRTTGKLKAPPPLPFTNTLISEDIPPLQVDKYQKIIPPLKNGAGNYRFYILFNTFNLKFYFVSLKLIQRIQQKKKHRMFALSDIHNFWGGGIFSRRGMIFQKYIPPLTNWQWFQ